MAKDGEEEKKEGVEAAAAQILETSIVKALLLPAATEFGGLLGDTAKRWRRSAEQKYIARLTAHLSSVKGKMTDAQYERMAEGDHFKEMAEAAAGVSLEDGELSAIWRGLLLESGKGRVDQEVLKLAKSLSPEDAQILIRVKGVLRSKRWVNDMPPSLLVRLKKVGVVDTIGAALLGSARAKLIVSISVVLLTSVLLWFADSKILYEIIVGRKPLFDPNDLVFFILAFPVFLASIVTAWAAIPNLGICHLTEEAQHLREDALAFLEERRGS